MPWYLTTWQPKRSHPTCFVCHLGHCTQNETKESFSELHSVARRLYTCNFCEGFFYFFLSVSFAFVIFVFDRDSRVSQQFTRLQERLRTWPAAHTEPMLAGLRINRRVVLFSQQARLHFVKGGAKQIAQCWAWTGNNNPPKSGLNLIRVIDSTHVEMIIQCCYQCTTSHCFSPVWPK